MIALRVNLGARSYDIAIVSDALDQLGAFARARTSGRRAFIVTDAQVARHLPAVVAALTGAGFETLTHTIASGEPSKSLATASTLYDRLAEARADRDTLVVALGGGVVGDLAGFVAATYARGLKLLMVPTTLLGMVDSSVGGKVGINHPTAKNLIGAFHQPCGVFIDSAFLNTLPEREYRSGLAEVVKYGVALDAAFFEFLETHTKEIRNRDPATLRQVIERCCALKAQVVEADENDTLGKRAVLNYGHTFGHAFETLLGYGAWLHGEAVAAGMSCAGALAVQRGIWRYEEASRQDELLAALGLPLSAPDFAERDVLGAMQGDKKTQAGQLRFVLPSRLGHAGIFRDIPTDDVRAALAACKESRRNPRPPAHTNNP